MNRYKNYRQANLRNNSGMQLSFFKLILALLVFCTSYMFTYPRAITMESQVDEQNTSQSDVVFEVWYNDSESADDDTPQVEETVQTLETINAPSLLPSFGVLPQYNALPEDDGESFKDYIDTITIQKDVNGSWVGSTVFDDGDSINVMIYYTVKAGSNIDGVMFYQLPEEINTTELGEDERNGPVMWDGVRVGSYNIRENGKIVIRFNDNFDTSRNFTGHIEFDGSLSATDGNEGKDLNFKTPNIESGETDYRFEYTNKPTDIATDKKVSAQNDNTFDYTVKVSSKNGTNEQIVQINDAFTMAGNGEQNGQYVEGSFAVTKTSGEDDPITTDINYTSLNIDNNATPSSFNMDLPPLSAKEYYTITYKAKPQIDETTANLDGSMKINNKVKASSDEKESENSISSAIKSTSIDKTGNYDAQTKSATWTITIKTGGKNLEGYTLEDIMGSNITSTIPPFEISEATISADNKTPTNILDEIQTGIPNAFSYTFGDTTGVETYVIKYKTDLSGVPSDQEVEVYNEADLKDSTGDLVCGDTAPSLEVYNTSYTVIKTCENPNPLMDEKYWKTQITIPENTTNISDDLIFTDTIDRQLESDHYAHYTTAGALREMVDNLPDNLNINYEDITIICLDYSGTFTLDNNTILDDKQVTKFLVTIANADVKNLGGQTITLNYTTFLKTDLLISNKVYDIKNTAEVDGKTSTAQTTYEKKNGLQKFSNISGEQYTDSPQVLNYDVLYDEALGKYVMKYRVKFMTDIYTLEQLKTLVITDTLPDGTSLVASSVRYGFTDVNNGFSESFWNSKEEKTHTASDYFNLDDSDLTEFKFKLSTKFSEDYTTLQNAPVPYPEFRPMQFFIEYKITLPDPKDWGDNVKGFQNIVSSSLGEDPITNDVTVRSDEYYVSKDGLQQTTTDEDGNTSLKNEIDFNIYVNRNGKDLDPDSKTLMLTDTMQFVNAPSATARLLQLHVYDYTDGIQGAELNTEQCKYTSRTESSGKDTNYIFELTVPDGKALLVKYTYSIDPSSVTASKFKIKNNVKLKGEKDYADEDEYEIKKASSAATVSLKALSIYKHETDNEGKTLSDVEFKIENYNGTGWIQPTNIKTNSDGKFQIASAGEITYADDILYRLVETKAPNGYELDATPRYFVFVSNGSVVDDTYKNSITMPSGIDRNSVIYVVNSNVELRIPNTKIDVPFTLPSTGGQGGMSIKILGVAMFLASTIIYINIIKKRGKSYEK